MFRSPKRLEGRGTCSTFVSDRRTHFSGVERWNLWDALHLIDHDTVDHQQKRFEARARAAKLRHDAQIENADFRAARGLDRNLFMALAGCDWIRKHHSLLVTGPAGVGKSWLACALGHKACREDFSVAYHRVPRLFATLALARGDGRYGRTSNRSPRPIY
jgi:DNA replication protein DnaC